MKVSELVKSITEKVMSIFKIEKIRGEYYIKVESPEEFRKIVKKTVRMELADLMRENMQLKKQIKELSQTIEVLRKEKEEALKEEVERQRRAIANIIESAQFNLFFDLKKPVMFLTNEGNYFVDETGKEHPYLQGIRFVQLPDNVKVEFILSYKKRTRKPGDLTYLSPYPPITFRNIYYIPQNINAFIKSLRLGTLVTNITEEGYLLTGMLPVYLLPPKKKGERE
ncbi:MAG: hypothetical protein ACTSUR_02930 [Candidatus Heimdallarchaeaceae archaeon]